MRNRKTIIYDARMIEHSGIGMQVQNVIPRLLAEDSFEFRFLGNPETLTRYIPESLVIPYYAGIYSLREQISFPARGDLYHTPHYNARILSGNKNVVVIHDVIHLKSEEFQTAKYQAYAKSVLWAVTRSAKKIITVSDTAKADLLEFFPFAASKTVTIHNGIDRRIYKTIPKPKVQKFKAALKLPKDYLLCVGIGKKHKNLDFVIRAFAPLWRARKIPPLVLAGSSGQLPDYVRDVVVQERMIGKVISLPHLDLDQLPILYNGATALIMPSKLEGFGFPAAEAMACGVPVISSNASSLPEVCGNAAKYFDPFKEDELRKAILEVLRYPRLRREMSQKGLKQVKKFDWDDHVRRLISVYRECLL